MHRCLLFLSLFACWVEAENGFGRKGDITGLKLEIRDFYEDAKYFYKEHFARQQQNVIKDLSDLRNEIQEEVQAQQKKVKDYSYFGAVGAGLLAVGYVLAPVPAAAVTTCGAVISVSSVVANCLYTDRTATLVKKKLDYAERSLKRYDRFCSEMNEYLLPLEGIKSSQNGFELIPNDKAIEFVELLKVAKFLDIATVVKRLNALNIPIPMSEFVVNLIKTGKFDTLAYILKTVANIPSKVLGAGLAISIVLEIRSIMFAEDYLKDFANGRLCDEAQKLDNVITEIKLEATRFESFFVERP